MEKMIPQRINSVRPDAHELQTQSFICITPRMLAACLAAPFFPAVILAVLATARISGDSWIGLLIFPIWACSYTGFVILGLPGIFMLNKHNRLTLLNLSIYGAIAGSIPYLGISLIFSMNGPFSTDLEYIFLNSLGTLFGLGIALIFGMIIEIKNH